MTKMPLRKRQKTGLVFLNLSFWNKMATKMKPQGPRCKRFPIWTKMAKVTKP
ncbi:hypothetical protein Hanom_Chr15g01375921 [Helianthus anomalus]